MFIPENEAQIIAAIQAVADQMELKKKIIMVTFRPDYQDYMFILDDKSHCEIRQKLIEDFLVVEPGEYKGDILREIKFLLTNAPVFQEWELEDLGLGQIKTGGDKSLPPADGKSPNEPKGGIVLDNSEDFDF